MDGQEQKGGAMQAEAQICNTASVHVRVFCLLSSTDRLASVAVSSLVCHSAAEADATRCFFLSRLLRPCRCGCVRRCVCGCDETVNVG